jgi:hypothetical protein
MFLLLIDLASTRFVTTYYRHIVDVLPSWIGAGNPPVDVSQAKTVTHESMPANRPAVYFFFGLEAAFSAARTCMAQRLRPGTAFLVH